MVEEEPKPPNFDRQQNPTPRELFEQGQATEVQGNKLAAADLYERAGYTHKAIQIYEAEGNPQKAYELAKRTGDNWTADRLAITHNIPGHEYSDFPPAQGREFDEVMRIAFKSRLHPEATAGRLGFAGFKGRIVADVGTKDGRFVPLFRELGASEVYGIDPDQKALQEAIDKGILDKQHALPYKLQDIPKEVRGSLEIATIFNFNMPYSEQADFFEQLYDSLSENAQVVMTVAEDEILENARKFIEPLFIMRSQRLWNKSADYPHKNLVVLTKKPSELKK
jgi:hypothetical protein